MTLSLNCINTHSSHTCVSTKISTVWLSFWICENEEFFGHYDTRQTGGLIDRFLYTCAIESYFVRLRNALGCYCVRHSKLSELKLRGRQSTTLDGVRPLTADNDRTVELTLLLRQGTEEPVPFDILIATFKTEKGRKKSFSLICLPPPPPPLPPLHSQQPRPQGLESGRRKGKFLRMSLRSPLL